MEGTKVCARSCFWGMHQEFHPGIKVGSFCQGIPRVYEAGFLGCESRGDGTQTHDVVISH